MSSEVMIEARDLVKRYDDVVALDKVSMEVRRGEVLGFLGPNGAGKSTTMRILTCFTSPTEGSAKINGHDVLEESLQAREAIGYLPESNPLYPDLLVLEYLQFVAEVRGLDKAETRKRLKTIVEETGLGDVYAKQIRTLSKGYRQRVGLAQALIHQPPILILDEPMSGLDPNQAVEIRDLIKDIGRERTVVLSTHNLAEVQVACDRVLIINKGKIVADDTPDGLRDRAGKTRYLVTVQGEAADKCESALKAIDGVERVRGLGAETGELRFELLPTGSDDLRPRIFKAAVDNDLTLLGLGREGQGLEQIFRDLTTSEEAAGASDSANADAAE
ncbi:MAG: ATP-binding cassette domain-containing protein [Myxococcales bacterium]|nr:ATP-binding cassette domain-containing protein [Myxococcales bacterium]